jgi:serine-type D-Ala-D-Ala carboxypeptidase/endopeptidase (penicillin-binding protein 4)
MIRSMEYARAAGDVNSFRAPMRRSFRTLAFLCAVCALSAPGASAQTISPDLARSMDEWYARSRRIAPGQWGVAVATSTGRVLWTVNPEAQLIPASTAKIFTTGFARGIVGPDARIATRVLGRGHLDSAGAWIGAWGLELNGDPTLERTVRSGPMLRDLAKKLSAAGVRELRGPMDLTSTTGTTDTRIPAVWGDRYVGQLYAPPVGCVTLHENRVGWSLRPAGVLGAPPTIVYAIPAGSEALVKVTARTVPGSGRKLTLTALPDGLWELSGTIGIRSRIAGVSTTSQRPDLVLREAWGAALSRAGIRWVRDGKPTRPGLLERADVLAEVTSAPFDSLAMMVNRRSLNIGAEALLRWADGSSNAAERLTRHVQAIVGAGAAVRLVDGSGLSPLDRVSPLTQALYLARLPRTPGLEAFPTLLPANGHGTLRHFGRGVLPAGVMRAKTGTLDSVSALAGYLGRRDGVLVISTIYNGPRSRTAKRQQWNLFRLLGAGGMDLATAAEESETQLGGEEEGGVRH